MQRNLMAHYLITIYACATHLKFQGYIKLIMGLLLKSISFGTTLIISHGSMGTRKCIVWTTW